MAKKDDKAKKSEETPVVTDSVFTYSVLVEPYVTEKSYAHIKDNKYTFVVTKDSNRFAIKKAVESAYNVKVLKVNILRTKSEKIFVKGKVASTSTIKKAVVTLQKGYSLTI